MIDIIIFIVMILYAWLSSFLFHEFFHIKSQGLNMTGTINIKTFSMEASPREVTNSQLLYYSGGVFSGLLHLILGIYLWIYNVWSFYIPFITFGVLNLVYGIWEGYYGHKGRYKIYITTLVIMIAFWIIKYLLKM